MCFSRFFNSLRIGILLFAFIGVFSRTSIAYADNYRNWSVIDFKNFLMNWAEVKTSYDLTDFKNAIDNNDSIMVEIVSYLNEYEKTNVIFRSAPYGVVDIQLTNSSSVPYLYNNAFSYNSTPTGKTLKLQYDSVNKTFTLLNSDNINDALSFEHYRSFRYYGSDVKTSSNNNTIIFNGGYYEPADAFEENYYFSSVFKIDLFTNNNTEYITINTDTGNNINNIPILYNNSFGVLTDNKYIFYINDLLGFWYYNGVNWSYKLIYNRNKQQALLKNNNYMKFNYNHLNDNETCTLSINDLYTYKNVVYHFSVNNAQLDNASCYFLIGDNNTIVNNGILSTSGDFFINGNYEKQFENLDDLINNNDNTDEIIESVTSIENIDTIINDTLSGDSETLASQFGFGDFDIENPFTTFLYNLVENVYTALTEREDIIIDLNHHNLTTWVINTRDFVTPEGNIKNLVRWCLIFLYVYGNYKYYHYFITLLQTAKIDKAIAELGTDEFYDSDIM